jgi:hypothetical protein
VRRALATAVAVAGLGALPATAAAHGRSAPVASDWRAAIERAPHGVTAEVVDGDRDLWMATSAPTEVVGLLGEPMLRFGRGGVWANASSPTAHADRILTPGGSGWIRVARRAAYRWHEHRLHAGEAGAGTTWSVPLVVDGRRTAISGSLRRVQGGRAWPWLAAAAVAGAAATWRSWLRVPALVAVGAGAAARAGYELHGRPSVAWSGYADAVGTAVLAVLLAAAVVFGRTSGTRAVAALIAGVLALTQALWMSPAFLHGLVFDVLGTTTTRALLAATIAGGAAASIVAFRALVREET